MTNQKKNLYADLFRTELNNMHLKFQEAEGETGTRFYIGMLSKGLPPVRYSVIIRPNGQCTIHSYICSKISKSKQTAVAELLNVLNGEDRYAKYYLDPDNDVAAEYDFICFAEADEAALRHHMFALFILFTDHVEEALSRLLKIVHQGEDCEDPNDKIDRLLKMMLADQ